MDCMREETFGPTLPVMKVRDGQEAIAKANDSRYGLSGSVWTRDKAKGMALAKQMATGSVNINNAMSNILQYPVPYAGWKESGTARARVAPTASASTAGPRASSPTGSQ